MQDGGDVMVVSTTSRIRVCGCEGQQGDVLARESGSGAGAPGGRERRAAGKRGKGCGYPWVPHGFGSEAMEGYHPAHRVFDEMCRPRLNLKICNLFPQFASYIIIEIFGAVMIFI